MRYDTWESAQHGLVERVGTQHGLGQNSPVFSMTCSSLSWEYGCSWQKVSISHTVTPKAHTSLAVVNLPWEQDKQQSNAYYCFPCLLFGGSEAPWTTRGVRDLKHLADKCRRHDGAHDHLDNSELQLDEGYRVGVRRHNREVAENRHVLSRVIESVKFCAGAFELALRCHGDGDDDEGGGEDPGTSTGGLEDPVASLDLVLKENLEHATAFNGSSQSHIIQEARSSGIVSIQADQAMDVAARCHLALVLRYIDAKHDVQETFFEFIPLQRSAVTEESVATALQERLSAIVPEDQRGKLICQAYDGARVALRRGAAATTTTTTTTGVQRRIQAVYPNTHYVHCYAHRLPLIMQQATSHIAHVRPFFADLGGHPSGRVFWIKSWPVDCPHAVRWDVNISAVNTVSRHREDLALCFQRIRGSSGDFDLDTVREAAALARLLDDQDFRFLLQLFHYIMPRMDVLYARLQKRSVDSAHVHDCIQHFQRDIQKIRDTLMYPLVEQISGAPPSKRCRPLSPKDHKKIAAEVCDTIVGHTRERFRSHLVAATLLQADRFEQYKSAFPNEVLRTTAGAYPMLNGNKLKTELRLIYSKDEFQACRGAVDLFQLFMENDLEEVFSETVTLLKILITTPMTTAEAERCFSTSKRMEVFLRNAMTQERLNALAMLSMEKRLVTEMPDFNQKLFPTRQFLVARSRWTKLRDERYFIPDAIWVTMSHRGGPGGWWRERNWLRSPFSMYSVIMQSGSLFSLKVSIFRGNSSTATSFPDSRSMVTAGTAYVFPPVTPCRLTMSASA
ncbi:hypothetical protein CRUP_030317 [Coryphaenoides rupestris]|nr:hypothetical protein CRUP_030317 [Coryphaenoides rupestris]